MIGGGPGCSRSTARTFRSTERGLNVAADVGGLADRRHHAGPVPRLARALVRRSDWSRRPGVPEQVRVLVPAPAGGTRRNARRVYRSLAAGRRRPGRVCARRQRTMVAGGVLALGTGVPTAY